MGRKGQEEVVGFVAIVVIISVIGLVFLGIIANPNNNQEIKDSNDIRIFLGSMLEVTSGCEITINNFIRVEDLITECYDHSADTCLDGNNVCSELNDTMRGMLDGAYRKVGSDFQTKGYTFRASYSENYSDSSESKILVISKGNCTTSTGVSGEQFFSVFPGKIYTRLKLCY